MKRFAIALSMLVLMFAAPVFGQAEVGDIPQDNIDLLEYQRPIWEYVTGGLFLVVVLAIGFKASKRAHTS